MFGNALGILRRHPHVAAGAALYAIALALRLTAWRSPIDGDEAWHFYAARHLFSSPDNVIGFPGDRVLDVGSLFLWRPLFEAGLAPAAFISFDAWRLACIALTALTPCLAAATLLRLKSQPILAYGAGVALLVLPIFFRWGTVVFPDGPLTVAVAAALWARAGGHVRLSAALHLAAMWTKESAAVAVGYFLVVDLVASLRDGSSRVWPPRIARAPFYGMVVGVLGVLPLAAYALQGGRPPGWNHLNDGFAPLDRLVVFLPLLPVLVAGLAWPRTRVVAGLALAYPAFYLTLTLFADRHIELWYLVLPSYVAVMAVAYVLDEARLAAKRVAWKGARRGVAVVAVGLALLVVAHAVLPQSTPGKGALTHPITGESDRSLVEEIRWTNMRGQNDEDLFAAVTGRHDPVVALVDVDWFYALYPFAETSGVVRQAYTASFEGGAHDAASWAALVEERANLTVVGPVDAGPLNAALRAVYHDCLVFENPSYLAFEGARCPGRAAALEDRYRHESAL